MTTSSAILDAMSSGASGDDLANLGGPEFRAKVGEDRITLFRRMA